MLIDTHCHLDHEQFDTDRDEVINRALEAGVEQIVTIVTFDGQFDFDDSIFVTNLTTVLIGSIGVHPHDASKADDGVLKNLSELIKHPKMIALGEIGLDYHYDFSPRDQQKAAFINQMAIARDAGKPIVIHTREAWDDTLALLEEHWKPTGLPGIMHCFSGNPAQAERCLSLGFYLSFGGILTFPKALEIQEAARLAPADRILVETDAPYLAPVPKRGKRNEPAFVVETARKLAALRGTSLEDIAETTSKNFQTLVKL